MVYANKRAKDKIKRLKTVEYRLVNVELFGQMNSFDCSYSRKMKTAAGENSSRFVKGFSEIASVQITSKTVTVTRVLYVYIHWFLSLQNTDRITQDSRSPISYNTKTHPN